MITNYQCDSCRISDICKVKVKMKPFSDEAKTELGVTFDFIDCINFIEDEALVKKQ